ncbi:PiggyBac transposable element-derived protein 4 [Acropora cervicornis]|uniref:PiggyBac transposable element-derived protein 4 n=1 Tax=Acropora cervicornis TaxID=6130 RepID=A0AAD9V6M4_ACRCE|nr:PiggyBac transposable element-derived protein 4 [Acropora cervicornis]
MASYTVNQVLDMLWNESGDEEDISGDEFDENDEAYVGESESSDHDSSRSSEEEPEDNDPDGSESDNATAGPPPKRQRNRRAAVPLRQWVRANLLPPQSIPFTGQPGIQVNTDGFEAIDYFELFINDDIINYLVTETNTFAEQFIRDNNLKRKSRVHAWQPTDPKEMKHFLGLTFLMGIIQKPNIQMYWSNDPLYSTPIFKQVMNRDRYLLILKFLHFNNNDNTPGRTEPNPDKLFKIRPLVDHLFEKFQEIYTPSKNVCIDESLLLWKGRLHFKQYIPLKRSRFRIKLFMLCEDGGYTYRFRVCTGKDTLVEGNRNLTISEKIVEDLMLPLLHKGYHLYIDNWYTSITLLQYLRDNDTLACGTIRKNRKGFPDAVSKAKLRQWGESIAYRSDALLALKFKDTREVYILTTIHDERMQNVRNRRNPANPIQKPKCIVDYNHHMGGVDRTDPLLEPFKVARKSMKWYKKLAMHLIQLSLLNSFLLYKKDGGRKPLLDFQRSVIASLLFTENTPEIPREEAIARLTERHFIAPIPPTEKKDKPKKRCKICTKQKIRKESRYHCPTCPSNPGLCYYPCFEKYHTEYYY